MRRSRQQGVGSGRRFVPPPRAVSRSWRRQVASARVACSPAARRRSRSRAATGSSMRPRCGSSTPRIASVSGWTSPTWWRRICRCTRSRMDRATRTSTTRARGAWPGRRSARRFVDAFCETGAYTVAECERLFTAARAQGLRPKIHAEQRSHSGGALLAAQAGAVSADHLEHASNTDLEAMSSAGVVGVILPGASLVLGGPPPPGRRLLEAGCTVAVATDCNPGTCYSESMPLMISLAVALGGLTPGAGAGGGHRGRLRRTRAGRPGHAAPGAALRRGDPEHPATGSTSPITSVARSLRA